MGDVNYNHELLHGVSLAMILDYLVDYYGYDELAEMVRINCFTSNPTKMSCLKFLRKTEWARLQVQGLYVRTKKEEMSRKK
ncbi:MAG: VF530 family protein [Candidatus Gracilibacteria bacterium]|nr:VF530 family protein [Candidatus Gracilibacteria bacterium]